MIFSTPLAPVVCYSQAALILDHIAKLVDQPDFTRVHWAQFMESSVDSLGVVSLDGHRRAAYNAFKLYAMMPIDRRLVEVSQPLSALASTDKYTSGLLLWNRSRSDKSLSVALDNLPFARGTLRVYRIDEEHASYFENPDSENLTPATWHGRAISPITVSSAWKLAMRAACPSWPGRGGRGYHSRQSLLT